MRTGDVRTISQPVPPGMDAGGLAWSGAAAMLALALPSVLALLVDDRTLFGDSVWNKPLRFDAALALHLLTLWALVRCLPAAEQARPSTRRAVAVGVFCSLLEALYITLQAARGRASHFNVQTPLETFLYYGVMGPAAVLIVGSAFYIGWRLWRHADPSVPEGLRRGGALGLMLGSAATLLVASALSSGVVDGLGHWVGGVRSDATGLPFSGWSRSGGDLRVPHFFATHLMQALPLAGWLADRAGSRHARTWVHLAAAVGLLLVGLTFWQALQGRAFLPF